MIFASNNQNKLSEIRQIFNEYQIQSLNEAKVNIDVEEDQDSFYGNALKKAKEIYEITKQPVIADDSGICIDYFAGWPGVHTARFLGTDKTTKERNDYIIDKMRTVPIDLRGASVICVLVYYDGESIITGEGILTGKISLINNNTNKFGFDDIFELENGIIVSNLSAIEKNGLSARWKAACNLKEKLSSKIK